MSDDKKTQEENRPEDLITAEEAGVMADKKKDTIRSWVRKNKLTGYRQDPENKTSALMVSKAELLLYLGTKATVTHENNKGRPEDISVSLKEKDKEIESLKQQIELQKLAMKNLEDRLRDLQAFNELLQVTVKDREGNVQELQSQLKDMLHLQGQLQDSYRRSQDEYKALISYVSMPFWKRWTNAVPLLEG